MPRSMPAIDSCRDSKSPKANAAYRETIFSNDLRYRALLVANCELCELRTLRSANFAKCELCKLQTLQIATNRIIQGRSGISKRIAFYPSLPSLR